MDRFYSPRLLLWSLRFASWSTPWSRRSNSSSVRVPEIPPQDATRASETRRCGAEPGEPLISASGSVRARFGLGSGSSFRFFSFVSRKFSTPSCRDASRAAPSCLSAPSSRVSLTDTICTRGPLSALDVTRARPPSHAHAPHTRTRSTIAVKVGREGCRFQTGESTCA